MIALDTNVLIYACDQTDPRRQQIALELVTRAEDGVLLWQVACEFIAATQAKQPGIHLDPCVESPRRVPRSAAARDAVRGPSSSERKSFISRAAPRSGMR
jgi:predicted nucleic acid-binding protein